MSNLPMYLQVAIGIVLAATVLFAIYAYCAEPIRVEAVRPFVDVRCSDQTDPGAYNYDPNLKQYLEHIATHRVFDTRG